MERINSEYGRYAAWNPAILTKPYPETISFFRYWHATPLFQEICWQDKDSCGTAALGCDSYSALTNPPLGHIVIPSEREVHLCSVRHEGQRHR